MDKPIKHTSGRKIRSAMKVGEIQHRNVIKGKEDRYVAKHHEGSFGVTKGDFMALLTKAAQPISERLPDSKVKGTSVAHRADGCSGKRKNQGKTEGKEG